jgi:hypothetical protein
VGFGQLAGRTNVPATAWRIVITLTDQIRLERAWPPRNLQKDVDFDDPSSVSNRFLIGGRDQAATAYADAPE